MLVERLQHGPAEAAGQHMIFQRQQDQAECRAILRDDSRVHRLGKARVDHRRGEAFQRQHPGQPRRYREASRPGRRWRPVVAVLHHFGLADGHRRGLAFTVARAVAARIADRAPALCSMAVYIMSASSSSSLGTMWTMLGMPRR